MPEKQVAKEGEEKNIFPKKGLFLRNFSFTKDEMEEKLRAASKNGYFGRKLSDKDIVAFVDFGKKYGLGEDEFILFCKYYDKGINPTEFKDLRENNVAVKYNLSVNTVKTLIKIRNELNNGTKLQNIFQDNDDPKAVKTLKDSKPPTVAGMKTAYNAAWEKYHEPATIYSIVDTEQGKFRRNDDNERVAAAAVPLDGSNSDYGTIRQRRRIIFLEVIDKYANKEVIDEIAPKDLRIPKDY